MPALLYTLSSVIGYIPQSGYLGLTVDHDSTELANEIDSSEQQDAIQLDTGTRMIQFCIWQRIDKIVGVCLFGNFDNERILSILNL
jgi:hypothetical protein